LLALPIPIISDEVQAQVQDAVRQASQARRLANQLLIAAKHAVEIAIEDSESAALNFLDAAFTSESQ
jgi:type I restriction enzyme S subunit